MRIFGGKDYYDGVQSIGGYDQSIVFDRSKQWEIENKQVSFLPEPIQIPTNQRHTWEHLWVFHVIFAGKIYCGLRMHLYDIKYPGIRIMWDPSDIRQVLHECGIETKQKWFSPFSSSKLLDEIGKVQQPTDQQMQYILDNKIVVGTNFVQFVGYSYPQPYKWTFNGPLLKQMKFMQVKDSYQAYQELAQFVSNDLVDDKAKMIKITDEKTQVSKHGFDKFSFRKQPRKGL